jgi:hypothetical protein
MMASDPENRPARTNLTLGEIQTRFTYHPPKGDEDVAFYQEFRVEALSLAISILEGTRPSREQSLAITHLEQAVMWANAGRARRGSP